MLYFLETDITEQKVWKENTDILECCTDKLTNWIIKNDHVIVGCFSIHFIYKNTLYKNTEAQITQKLRTI